VAGGERAHFAKCVRNFHVNAERDVTLSPAPPPPPYLTDDNNPFPLPLSFSLSLSLSLRISPRSPRSLSVRLPANELFIFASDALLNSRV